MDKANIVVRPRPSLAALRATTERRRIHHEKIVNQLRNDFPKLQRLIARSDEKSLDRARVMVCEMAEVLGLDTEVST